MVLAAVVSVSALAGCGNTAANSDQGAADTGTGEAAAAQMNPVMKVRKILQ